MMKTARENFVSRITIPIRIHRALIGVLTAAAMISAASAQDQDGTWSGGSGNWSTSSIWTDNLIANGTDYTAFTSGNANKTLTVDTDRTIGNIRLHSANANVHTIASSGANTLTLAVSSGTPFILQNARGTRSIISATIDGSQGWETGYNTGADPNGTLRITGDNIYTGTTGLKWGTIEVGHANALSTSTISFGGGGLGSSDATAYSFANTIEIAGNVIIGKGNGTNPGPGTGALTFSDTAATPLGATRTFTIDPNLTASFAQAFSGSGFGITKLGTGTLILSGTNTYTAGTTISAGSLVLRNLVAKPASGTHAFATGTTLGLGVGGAGYFTSTDVDNAFAGNMTGNLSDVTVNANTSVGIDTTAGDFTYATSVSGSPTRGLVKLGANTLTLSGANTYTGGTTVNEGKLTMNNASALGATSGALTLNNNATLDLNGNDLTVGTLNGTLGTTIQNSASGTKTLTINQTANGTFAGVVQTGTGDIAVVKNGNATLVLGNVTSTYSGGTTLNAGVIDNVWVNSLGSGTITFGGNAELRASRQTTDVWSNDVQIDTDSKGQINAINQYYRFSTTGVLSGNGTLWATATDNGSGNVIFSNTANTFTGTVEIGSTGKVGSLQISSLADSTNAIKLGATTGAGNLTFSGTAASQLYTNREVQLTGTTGGGRINNNGTTANIVTFTEDLAVVGTGNKSLTLGGSNTGNNAFNGIIADGTGSVISLTKADAGKWILSGVNTYSGITTVSGGTLALQGDWSLPHAGTLNRTAGSIDIEGRAKVAVLQAAAIAFPPGIYGSTESGAEFSGANLTRVDTTTVANFFTGTGVLYVGIDFPPSGTVLILR